MLVNCEKTRTRWPAGELLADRARRKASSFADSFTARAASIATSRGSQQTWRSLVSASRIAIADAGEALGADCLAHVGVRGHADGLVEVALLAAQLDGHARAPSWRELLGDVPLEAPQDVRGDGLAERREPLGVPLVLDGLAPEAAEGELVAEQAGASQSKIDHSSPRWFSTGVPVRHTRCSATIARERPARLAPRVLDGLRLVEHDQVEMRSSAKRSSSRTTTGYVVTITSAFAAAAQRPWRSGPCRTTTRSAGAKRAISRDQLPTSVVGPTMSAGASRRPSVFSIQMCAIVCSVLPSPISSASTPPTPLSRSRWRNATPSLW